MWPNSTMLKNCTNNTILILKNHNTEILFASINPPSNSMYLSYLRRKFVVIFPNYSGVIPHIISIEL